MPFWARFLVGSGSGAAVALLGTLVVALWRVGWPEDGTRVWAFALSGALWGQLLVFWALNAASLVAGGVLAGLSGWVPGRCAALIGAVAALGYGSLVGIRAGLPALRVLPDAALLAAVLVLAGAVSIAVQDRL
ncbi:MAG: hypothetical protein L6E13_00805 [Firmicutes bacterium]|nr:hypothetical protein [Bacillota bacterium]